MGRHKLWRCGAFSMAAVLTFGTVFSGSTKGLFASAADSGATEETISFAEGDGTGTDFSETSWEFHGLEKDTKKEVRNDEYLANGWAPAIEKDDRYLKNNKKVIRLINGVKAQTYRSTGLEASDSYSKYRSGEAFLSKGLQLKSDAEFSAKFTFSMPEAVVNTTQTGGEEFAREVGGDGIAYVITTNATHDTQAGSGIGYQGIGKSVSIELDSYFNGAYYMGKTNENAYLNWNFDNQLLFHANSALDGQNTYPNKDNPYDKGDYVNYVNKGFAERFDHVAITKDGEVTKHLNTYYMNELDPTEPINASKDVRYKNLAFRDYSTSTASAQESTESTCSTRFADKGVDDRLFTVWVDYNTDGVMNVSIANGDYEHAVKPKVPQITNQVDLSGFDGQTVYMGFTSAIGSSKANHTIHSFSFTNVAGPTYKLNYYLKQDDGTYKLVKETPIYDDKELGETATAKGIDRDYVDAYKSYEDGKSYALSAEKTQEDRVVLEENGKVYEMNLYYDPEQAGYKLNYWKLDPNVEKYEYVESTITFEGEVGKTYEVTDADADYKDKYKEDNYEINPEENKTYSVKVEDPDTTYEMDVYYDPVKTTYKTEYYLKQPDGTYKLTDTVPGEETYAGKKVEAPKKEYDGYTHVTTPNSKETATVEADGSTVMKVYYDPMQAGYKLNYWKKDPNTGEYKYIESTDVFAGDVNSTYKVTDADSKYESKYVNDGYEINSAKNESYSVLVEKENQIYEMNAYYDPVITTYKTEYYLKQPDGTYKLTDTVPGGDVYAGTNVKAPDKSYDGYVHVTTPDSKESAVVEPDGSTTMKVYYDPEKAGYKLNYWKLNPNTDKYEFAECTKIFDGDVNSTYTVTDADAEYKTRYDKENYTINPSKDETYSVLIAEENKTYEMDVYYDPVKTTYKTEYYLKQPDGTYKLTDTVPGEETYAGKNVTAPEKSYENYVHVTTPNSKESAVVEPDGSTTMKVYYDPEKAGYKLNYYKLNPDTGKYEYVESTKIYDGEVSKTYTVTDADSNYETKYQKDDYTINPEKNETYSVVIKEENKTYQMDVYYDPVKTTYKTEYYLKQPDGTYKLTDTIPGGETYAGKSVTAPEKSYDGYVHVTTPDSKEAAVVEADGSTTMKVYYDPEPEQKPTYKVEYYVEQPDGTYELYTEVKDIEAETGEEVDAEIIKIPGYVHTIIKDSNESDVVKDDSSTVLKVYYNLVEDPTPSPTEDPEASVDGELPDPPVDGDEEGPEQPSPAAAPKTNDENHAEGYYLLMFSSILVFVVTLFEKRKEDEWKEQE